MTKYLFGARHWERFRKSRTFRALETLGDPWHALEERAPSGKRMKAVRVC